MKREKQLFKRLVAFMMSLALVITGVSFNGLTVSAETESETGENGLILYYDFDQGDNSLSTIISDKTGNASHSGELMKEGGGLSGSYSFTKETIFGNNVNVMNLNTNDEYNGPYLKLPDGILDDCDSVTISTWVKLTSPNPDYWKCLWNFQSEFQEGEEKCFYVWADSWDGWGCMPTISKTDYDSRTWIQKRTPIDKNRWVLTTVVMNGTVMSYYENGKLIGSADSGMTVKDLGHTTMNSIGNSPYGDGTITGSFAEFKIYNRALSADEVAAAYNPSGDDIIEEDKNLLDLGDVSGIMEDMKLPSKGINGSDITWTSNNDAIQIGTKDADGYYTAKVTRPSSGTGNVDVTLTATVAYGTGTPSTRDIVVTVVEQYSAQQIVDHDKAALVTAVGSLDNVFTKTISLPAVGEWGSSVAWTWEGAEGVITIPEQPETDGNFTAQVKRPAMGSTDATGQLKATLTSGDKNETVAINVKVWASHGSAAIIEKADTIQVNTFVGHSPSLPNYLRVSYSDGSTGKLKVIWPAYIDAEKYAAAGTFTVEGQVQGQEEKVTANVTVVEGTETAKAAVSSSFNLNEISLDKIGEDGSILTQNRERDITYLKLVPNERMLYNFYKTFGETDKIANVAPLGGWDAPTGLLRGHSTGHYLSALSLAYASTGDAELKAKLDNMVSEMRRLQKKSKGDPAAFTTKGVQTATWSTDPNVWGEGFISAYSPDQFALLEQGVPYGNPDSGIWAPYYTLHKLLAGLIDAYRCSGNEEALEAAKALGKWTYNRLKVLDQSKLTQMWDTYIAGEFGGFNESMAQLYIYAKADGDSDADVFLAGAKLFDNTTFFNNLVKNVDDIADRHANQHIPQIVGAIKMYEATETAGKPEMYYYNVAENFWQMTVSRYAYSTGGVGLDEKFTQPYQQAKYIDRRNCETCAAYNMMKLSMMLNNYNPDNAEYMDYYERTLYNQILASQCPIVTDNRHNGTTYMLGIAPGTFKELEMSDDFSSFTCCHGTGMENHVKYQEAAYAKTADDLYVGLYLPSTVTWKEKGVKVVQETVFPSETTKLTVKNLEGAAAKTFNMKLRVPYWASEEFTVKVNGIEKVSDPEVSTYVTLNNIKANDVIEITMPWSLHLDKTPDTLDGAEVASMMYGPFVMAAQNDSADWRTLVLPENLEDYVEISTNTANGFPILSTNGYSFAPMFAPEYATNGYHAYMKVSVSSEEGTIWNTRSLKKAINAAESKVKNDYTADSWDKMQTALASAKIVLANVNADQETINTAANTLDAAVKALVKATSAQNPGTPSSVTATWAGKKSVKITWGKASDADKYVVYRSYKKSSGYKMIGESTTTSYTDKKASAGKTAYYKVVAYKGNTAGADSAVKSAYVLKVPSGVKAKVSKKTVTVSYKKVKNANGYEIYRATKKNGKYKKVATIKSAKTVKKKFSKMKKGTYYYKVRAYKTINKKKVYTDYSKAMRAKVK